MPPKIFAQKSVPAIDAPTLEALLCEHLHGVKSVARHQPPASRAVLHVYRQSADCYRWSICRRIGERETRVCESMPAKSLRNLNAVAEDVAAILQLGAAAEKLETRVYV